MSSLATDKRVSKLPLVVAVAGMLAASTVACIGDRERLNVMVREDSVPPRDRRAFVSWEEEEESKIWETNTAEGGRRGVPEVALKRRFAAVRRVP